MKYDCFCEDYEVVDVKRRMGFGHVEESWYNQDVDESLSRLERHGQLTNAPVWNEYYQYKKDIEDMERQLLRTKGLLELYNTEVYFFGVRQIPNQEKEIFSDDMDCEYGFKVIAHKNPHTINEEVIPAEIQVYRNVTEVHYLYDLNNKFHDSKWDFRIAFDSDIHGTGCVRKISRYDTIHIERETRYADEFQP